MEQKDILTEIKSGNERVFSELYEELREPFFLFAKKYAVEEEHIVEIYQEAMVLFYENVVFGKIKQLDSAVKTYIFSIGKHKIYEHLRAKKKLFVVDDFIAEEPTEEYILEESFLEEKYQLMQKAFQKLGDRCQKILELFYYQNKSIKEIVEAENYENENTVKANKSRCLKKLRELSTNTK